MREKQIEQKIVKAIKDMEGIALKLTCPGFDGMPDRIILLPGGRVVFVEVKAPGMKPRPLQVARHEMLRRLGFKVYVLDDERQIGGILDAIIKNNEFYNLHVLSTSELSKTHTAKKTGDKLGQFNKKE